MRTYGGVNNNYLLTLCFVNNDHFKVVYEKNESNKTNNNINIKLAYANDNRVIKYNDII